MPERVEPLESQEARRGAVCLPVDQVGLIGERGALIDGGPADLDFALAGGGAGIVIDAGRLLVAPPLRLVLLSELIICDIARAALRLDGRNTAFCGDLLCGHRTEPMSP
ncbi:hypothetical protein [Methylorubrum thiocyanatum]|uniref:hypothetical protein n=1 Tax=Methylorubrum thiocyanatum TaxID=47958 RepID=UPI00365F7A7A